MVDFSSHLFFLYFSSLEQERRIGREPSSLRREVKENNLPDPKLVNKAQCEVSADTTSEGESSSHNPATRWR